MIERRGGWIRSGVVACHARTPARRIVVEPLAAGASVRGLGARLSAHFLRTSFSGYGAGLDGADSRTRLGIDFAATVSAELSEGADLVLQLVKRVVPDATDPLTLVQYSGHSSIGADVVFGIGGP